MRPATAAGSTTRSIVSAAHLGAESKCLGETQIHRGVSWTGSVIDGNELFAGSRRRIKSSERRAIDR